jgi:hypothetical protein
MTVCEDEKKLHARVDVRRGNRERKFVFISYFFVMYSILGFLCPLAD